MSLTIEKCLQAWANSLRQMNVKVDIVFFGDSLTYYGDFAHLFPDKVVCNLGLRGDTIQGLTERVDQLLFLSPSKVYLMAGINDVSSSTPLSFAESYGSLVKLIRRTVPKAELILQSMLPVNNRLFPISCSNHQIVLCNRETASISSTLGLQFIDLFSIYEQNGALSEDMTNDGIHIIPDAYNRWYNAIKLSE